LILEKYGIAAPAFWCLLRLDTRGQGFERDCEGEVDVIAGRITSEAGWATATADQRQRARLEANANGLNLFPAESAKLDLEFSYLVGLEIKCAFIDSAAALTSQLPVIKSAKTGPKKLRALKKELKRMLHLGLDRVGVLEVIAGPPIATDFCCGDPQFCCRHDLG